MKQLRTILALVAAVCLLAGMFALTASAAVDANAYAAEVVKLVNLERKKDGAVAFSSTDAKLNAAAQKRAQELVTKFSHTRPDDTSCFTVFTEFSVVSGAMGENIAAYYTSPSAVVAGWMDSKGHKENILNKSFNKIGVGVAESGGQLYWVQLFGYEAGVTPDPVDNPSVPETKWWEALPAWLQFILRYLFFGWIWMTF